jgi:hypothetical protein
VLSVRIESAMYCQPVVGHLSSVSLLNNYLISSVFAD